MAILQHQIIQRPVADVTTLKAQDVTPYSDGAIITVKSKGMYRYDPLSSATPDDDEAVLPSTGPGRWLRMTDAEIASHVKNFPDLGDVSGFYSVSNAIVTNNNTPNGLVEGGGTLSSAGALKVVSAALSIGSAVNEISNDTTLEDKETAITTEHVLFDVNANIQTALGNKLENVIEDTTPKLGGNLDTRGNTITTTLATVDIYGSTTGGNVNISTYPAGDINIVPNSAGKLNLNDNIADSTYINTLRWPTSDGTIGKPMITNSSGLLSFSTFDGMQIYHVSGNGSDTNNDGKRAEVPFVTIGKALTEAATLTPAAGNEVAIVCLEGTDFTEDINVDSYIHIYFPNATLNGLITVEGNASANFKNIKYSGTGVALKRTGGGTAPGYITAELVSCTAVGGDALENASGNLELALDRVEVNNGNGFQITGTAFTYTSGYINYMECINGGNGIDISGLNILSFGLHIGRLSAESGDAISLTSNATLNIEVIRLAGNNAYVINSSGAELNLSVTKLYGNEVVTAGTANVINPSGNSYLNGTVKAASFEGATGNAITGFSDDVTLAADSSTLGVTQHSMKTYIANFIAGLHWKEAVIDEVDFTTSEPGSPSFGDRYINTVTGTSSGTAQSVTKDYIYEWNNVDWTEFATEEGDSCYVDVQDTFKMYNGSLWITLNSIQTLIGLNDTFSAYTVANAFLQNNGTPDGVIQSTITANGGAVSGITSLTLPAGGSVTTTTGAITVSTGSGSNANIDLIPDGAGVIKLGKDLDVNGKALSSVASVNTVTWPAGGGNIGDIPTLTAPTTAVWQAPAGGGGVPDLTNTYYTDKTGNDSNSGKSLSKAKLTLTSANAAAGSTPSKFYITDNGTYTGDSFIGIVDSIYDCSGTTFTNSNIILRSGSTFSCYRYTSSLASGASLEHYGSTDIDPVCINIDIVEATSYGRPITCIGNNGNIQHHRIGTLNHSSGNSCITHQSGTTYFDIDNIVTSGSATGNVFNLSGDSATHTYVKVKRLDASGMNSAIPVFTVAGSNLHLDYDEIIGVNSTYQLFAVNSSAKVFVNGKNITDALIDNKYGNIKYYNLDTALLNFNPPRNLLVSGDFSKIPLWIHGNGLTPFLDADPVTPSFQILHSNTASARRNTSLQNELILQLTSTGYLAGFESLFEEEFLSYLTDLDAAGETVSVGFYGRATGITTIKMDIIQWIPTTFTSCLQDPIATWGSTPSLSSNSTGAWTYVASSSNITIGSSNSLITWDDISLSSFNTSATRLGLIIRTISTESSGDNIILKKLAKHRGYKFMGFEERDEVKKTETRIASTYNFDTIIGTSPHMTSAILSGFCYESDPDMMHAAHFNYNTSLVKIPVVGDVAVYNPFNGGQGTIRDLGGSNVANETIDTVSQHSVSVLAEIGWEAAFKAHVIVWPKPYQ